MGNTGTNTDPHPDDDIHVSSSRSDVESIDVARSKESDASESNEGSEWSTVRCRHAHSHDTKKKVKPLTSEQQQLIKKAADGLTREQKQTIERR
jgi:hypothetical protein